MKSEVNNLQLGATSCAPPKAGSICPLIGQTGTRHPRMYPWAAIKGRVQRESLENATQNTWTAVNGLCLEPLRKPHKDALSLVQACPAGRRLWRMAVWNGSSKLGKPDHMMPVPGNINPLCFPSLTWGNGFLGLGWKFLDMKQKGGLKTRSKPIYVFN